eukprot:Colp12_sorted_trinity150504_noHs@13958
MLDQVNFDLSAHNIDSARVSLPANSVEVVRSGGQLQGGALGHDDVLGAEGVLADHDAGGQSVQRVHELGGEGAEADQPAAEHVAEVLDGHLHLALGDVGFQERDAVLQQAVVDVSAAQHLLLEGLDARSDHLQARISVASHKASGGGRDEVHGLGAGGGAVGLRRGDEVLADVEAVCSEALSEAVELLHPVESLHIPLVEVHQPLLHAGLALGSRALFSGLSSHGSSIRLLSGDLRLDGNGDSNSLVDHHRARDLAQSSHEEAAGVLVLGHAAQAALQVHPGLLLLGGREHGLAHLAVEVLGHGGVVGVQGHAHLEAPAEVGVLDVGEVRGGSLGIRVSISGLALGGLSLRLSGGLSALGGSRRGLLLALLSVSDFVSDGVEVIQHVPGGESRSALEQRQELARVDQLQAALGTA